MTHESRSQSGRDFASSDRHFNAEPRGGSDAAKTTAPEIAGRKGGEKLVMLAAYDVMTARLAEAAGIDLILVGDSLGSVVLGYPSTVPVTMEEILHHTRAVVRGVRRTHVVADMPFMSFQVDDAEAIRNAGRLIKEGGADSVKVEGGRTMADRVRAIVRAGIPVMGHVGLTPQSAGALGGLRVQGNSPEAARALLDDARAIAEAGAFSLVIEVVPAALAEYVSERVPVPTIGIGAGAGCDGQVLVAADLLGLEDRLAPRYVKRYAELGRATRDAFARFVAEVRAGDFPAREHTYGVKPEVLAALRAAEVDPGA
jgi:3-methyl-2-oxobutanoate hydroxymethyltransferase